VKVGPDEKIDVLIGGGGRGQLSVFPPSLHHTGAVRAWTITPEQAEPADIPDALLRAIHEAARPAAGEIEHGTNARRRRDSPPSRSLLQAAANYLSKMDMAVSGQGGHNRTFAAACVLIKGFDLAPAEALPIFAAWNQTHCVPPWTEGELRHKLDDAHKKADDKARGWLRSDNDFKPGEPVLPTFHPPHTPRPWDRLNRRGLFDPNLPAEEWTGRNVAGYFDLVFRRRFPHGGEIGIRQRHVDGLDDALRRLPDGGSRMKAIVEFLFDNWSTELAERLKWNGLPGLALLSNHGFFRRLCGEAAQAVAHGRPISPANNSLAAHREQAVKNAAPPPGAPPGPASETDELSAEWAGHLDEARAEHGAPELPM
jgi:hypothetical protein